MYFAGEKFAIVNNLQQSPPRVKWNIDESWEETNVSFL